MDIENSTIEALLSVCRNSIERSVYYQLPKKEDAQDVLQQVFLTAYQKLDSLQDKSKFKAWLLSIASNKCNDFFREKIKVLEILLKMFIPMTWAALDQVLLLKRLLMKHLIALRAVIVRYYTCIILKV